ncbi:MAG: 4'-phosphopantetheinyl transferase superfamily protein [Muribaculaceae bacterium]|nr:4'-phosphopantetheinyl transferase superfamily protein [Muribaculaceae bacterium]
MATLIEIVRHFTASGCTVKIANVEPLAAPGALDDALHQLSHYRRDKTMRYRFDRGKHLSAGAGLLLDNMLREHGLRERDMQYSEGEHGKPFFVNHPELHFNLSHSGNLVACAIGNKPVGIDIQNIVKLRRSLVNYTMSAAEIAQLDAMTSVDDQELFFTQLWTLKESYVKATGTGLSHNFPSFAVHSDGTTTPLLPLNPPATFKTMRVAHSVVTVAIIS